jgi:hypothetical protein
MAEIDLIERHHCPACTAEPQERCRKGNDQQHVRIHPWNREAAGPGWVHKERRDEALAAGTIARQPGYDADEE